MKKLVAAVSGLLVIASASMASDGAAIFKSKGCTACHKAKVNTVGPSLATIAKAYKGKEAELVSYLKGKTAAIVDPKKGMMMKGQLNKVKHLPDADLKALANYILSN
jgi:cytochrome c